MSESNREEIAKLEALYANNPGGRVFTHLAEAYRKAGELDRARSILEAGMTRHGDYASAHVVLGRVMIDQGSLEAAASEFRRVLELDPENRVALRSLGDIAQNSDPENALEHYRHLRSLDPADEELANTIALLEAQLVAKASVAEWTPPPAPEAALAEADAPAETEPWVQERETTPAETPIQPTTADFGIEWHDELEQDGLPGDLAHLARAEEATPEPAGAEVWTAAFESPPPESPTVEEIPVAADYPEAVSAAESQVEDEAPAEPPYAEAEASVAQESEPLETEPFEEEPFEEPWASPVELAVIEAEASTIEVVAVIAVSENRTAEDEPLVDPAAAEPEEAVTSYREYSGFEEAADAALRPEGEIAFEELAAAQPEPEAAPAQPEPEMEATFEQMLSVNFGVESPPVTQEAGADLPTETLAELYRTQGFFGRAAEVYRALLADAPDDVRLSQRLREVEGLEHGPTLEADGERILELDVGVPEDDELSERVAASAEDSGPPEAWLEDIESAWTGGSGAADLDDSHYSWAHEGREEDAGGNTLQEYLKSLLAWRPSEPAPAALTEIAREVEEEADEEESFAYSVPERPSGQPAATVATAAQPASTLEDVAEPWEWTPETPQTPPPLQSSAPVSAHRPSAPAPTAPAKPGGSSVDDAFDEWFGEPASKSGTSSSATGTSKSASSSRSVDAEDEADDDLEVFRSWLQSLKR